MGTTTTTDRHRCPRCLAPLFTARNAATLAAAAKAAQTCPSVLHTAAYQWDARRDR